MSITSAQRDNMNKYMKQAVSYVRLMAFRLSNALEIAFDPEDSAYHALKRIEKYRPDQVKFFMQHHNCSWDYLAWQSNHSQWELQDGLRYPGPGKWEGRARKKQVLGPLRKGPHAYEPKAA